MEKASSAARSGGLYGDAEAVVAPGVKTVQVHDVAGDFHFARRKTAGTWINTGLFVQVWKQIAAEGKGEARLGREGRCGCGVLPLPPLMKARDPESDRRRDLP